MNPKQCLQAREAWSLSFDLEMPAPPEVQAHLAGCKECAAFARAAEGAHSLLRATPLPAPDPAADRRLLELLQPAAPEVRVSPLAAWLTLLRSPALPRFAMAGIGGFLVTVSVAYGLSLASDAHPGSAPSPGTAANRAPAGYLVNRIDLWLGPDASTARPAPRPAPPKPQKEVPRPSGRAGELPSLPVG